MIRKILLALLLALSIPVLSQAHRVISPATSSSGTAEPGGADTNVQYNDNGSLGGEADLTWNASTDVLTVNGTITLGATGITATGAELNYLDITTLGTGAASKAVVLDSGDDYTWPATGILKYGVLKDPAGTTLGATVAEINQHCDVSAMSELVTDDEVVAAADCGKTYFQGTDAKVFTLPATIAGCRLTFVNVGAAGNNNVRIDPDNADYIAGTFTLAASVVVKDTTDGNYIDNTKGTSKPGDSVTIVGNGVGGWFITASTGIWASE